MKEVIVIGSPNESERLAIGRKLGKDVRVIEDTERGPFKVYEDTLSMLEYDPNIFLPDEPKHNPVLQDIRREPKIGRNEICPCGSGKKYKHCCINKE